jgi:acetylornithine deacetylase/succinyl-diaminopimelate desuccinylase-like protein
MTPGSGSGSGEVRRSVVQDQPQVRDELRRLVRIPSVSAPGFDPAHVRASADATAEALEQAGCTGVRLLALEGVHPAVYGEAIGARAGGAPTVLLYAHHDVQPPGRAEDWDTPPFEPVERAGRLYGRGTSDDKAGIVIHTSAIRAHHGRSPVNVKVVVEGEEEIGSEHLAEFLRAYGDLLAADIVVVADSGNWKLGVPALTTSLRGLVDCTVEVRTLTHAVHSGAFGGPVPDALTCLASVLAALHDDRGNVAVPGLETGPSPDLDQDEAEFRATAGVLPGVRLIGEGSITERTWMRPAVSVLGIDAPTIAESSNQLVPAARARVSLRLAPGQDPLKALDALVSHVEGSAPWGAEVRVTRGAEAQPFHIRATGPAHLVARRALGDAWGTHSVDMGMGGTIPLVAAFSEAYPEAALLLTGAADPDCRAHGENESVDLGELERACVAEALLLSYLAEDMA